MRKAVEEAGRESMQVAVKFQDQKLAEAFDVLKQRGVQVQYPDQAPLRRRPVARGIRSPRRRRAASSSW